MKKITLLTFLCLSFNALAQCPTPWKCEDLKLNLAGKVTPIRTGVLPNKGQYKGDILYLEGLGDSLVNHRPLFSKLTQAGYRILAFDYPGQGGSQGSMNQSRIPLIVSMGELIWNKFSIQKRNPSKTVLGWSTGGLAAYLGASEEKFKRVILIAPGIAPNPIVGEGLFNCLPNEITLESLTTDSYLGQNQNPHLDPIKPNSPLKVPLFSINLLKTAHDVSKVKISSKVKGLVLLSGENDTYVNAEKTRKILNRKAPHFRVKSYPDALHEIDNEREEIRNKAHEDILKFLKETNS